MAKNLIVNTKASAANQDELLVTLGPYDDGIVDEYTEHTISNLIFIADDVRDEIIDSLEQGYIPCNSIPQLRNRIMDIWNVNRIRAVRFAQTETNEVYNSAHLRTYQNSDVITGVQVWAHLDSRTSDIYKMMHKTIWAKNDPDIERPPYHFGCRTRLLAYIGELPGERDFTEDTDFTQKDVDKLFRQVNTFKTKYWNIPTARRT